MRLAAYPCPIEESDAQIISQCLDGNRQKYSVLIGRHQASLIGYLRGRLGTAGAEAQEEIAQETFVRAFTKLKSLRKAESFLPWLIGITERVCRETQRAGRRHKAMLQNQRHELESQSRPAQSDADPEIGRAVAHLAEPYRQVVLLRFYQDLSCADVARTLEMPLGSVTKVLSRAYQMLRDDLARDADSVRFTRKQVQP